MADLDTGRDILRHLLRRCGDILPTATDDAAGDRQLDAKLYVNEAHWWVCGLRDWRWARKTPPAQFVSIAQDLVTVSSIAGTTVTLSASLAASRAGRKFMVDSDGIPHRVLAHTAATAVLTLATAYTGDTTSGAGTIFQDELTVATDILGWPGVKEVRTGGHMRLISEQELDELRPANVHGVTRGIRYGAFLTDSVLRIAPWTTEARLFECAYNVRAAALTFDAAAATDTPLVPQQFRSLIAWRAEEKVAHDKQDYDRAKRASEEVQEVLTAMQGVELSFKQPRLYIPRGQRISGR